VFQWRTKLSAGNYLTIVTGWRLNYSSGYLKQFVPRLQAIRLLLQSSGCVNHWKGRQVRCGLTWNQNKDEVNTTINNKLTSIIGRLEFSLGLNQERLVFGSLVNRHGVFFNQPYGFQPMQ